MSFQTPARTGRKTKTDHAGVFLYERVDGAWEVERIGVVIGTVERYQSMTEVKPGKVRASARRKPVQRWRSWARGGRGDYGMTTRKDAVQRLLDAVDKSSH